MVNDLTISSFIVVPSVITSEKEWNLQVSRDIGTLSSLAEINFQAKYYFWPIDSRFYESTWKISRTITPWIGKGIGHWLEANEEALYRGFWRISYNHSIEGILQAKAQIRETLLQAHKTVEKHPQHTPIPLLRLEEQIGRIHETLLHAQQGLLKLCRTYSIHPTKEEAVQNVVDDFYEDLTNFASEVLKLIKSTRDPPPIEIEEDQPSPAPLQLAPADPPPPLAQSPSPFPFPTTIEQRNFNENCTGFFKRTVEFYAKNQQRIQDAVQRAAEPFVRIKGSGIEETPWSVVYTKQDRVYFHYHVSIVPKGEGGKFKLDRRGYSLTAKKDVAKLSTKLYTERTEAVARHEERFLRLCTEKNLPYVVRTYDVFWIVRKGIKKQIIYQEFYENGNLQQNLQRLSASPEKIKEILSHLLEGLVGLHKESILHRDLKPANIFLDRDDVPHIGDLGFACLVNDEQIPGGTPLYMDPALFTGLQANFSSDVWSFGMIMYGMLKDPTKQRPWPWLKDARTAYDIFYLTKKYKDHDFPEPPREDVWMHVCWEALTLNPEHRPSASQLLKKLKAMDE